ncbi:hypothetical protein JOQ06_029889 [Pogonophryne albipinna]|uniref:Uncharacterized protein n=1 Tax=Pogonophryne albipinna TaxID=1090488 RepID=A0AAD6AYF8_9TELE|nr:hypothetical protein JOQ06_029889 [Pogonophryne albipinna]
MSLHEFLREGGEASYRIVNRLSHLIQNLDISGLGSPFPFNPASRRNSWRDWDGYAHNDIDLQVILRTADSLVISDK